MIDRVILTIETASPEVLEVSTPGPQGPAGVAGPQGPPGPPAVFTPYTHAQTLPSALWHVLHNRGYQPLVSVRDAAGNEVIAAVRHEDDTQLYIEFAVPFTGTAVLI